MFDWVLRRGSKELKFTVNELLEKHRNIRQDILRFDYFRDQNGTMSVFLDIFLPFNNSVEYFISGPEIQTNFTILKKDEAYIFRTDDVDFNEGLRNYIRNAFDDIWGKRVDKSRRGPSRRRGIPEYFLEEARLSNIPQEQSEENFLNACYSNFFDPVFIHICLQANLRCRIV